MNEIQCRGLTFSYAPDRSTLSDVSFDVAPGEICGLVGASGSGKSTLLRLVAGLLPGTAAHCLGGSIRVNGQLPEQARRAGKIGFVFQDMKLLPFLSARENLIWAQSQIRSRDGQSASLTEVEEALDLVGLLRHASAWPKELSGGMKARVALARALITKPRLLLLDEALASLDIGWRLHLHHELISLRERLQLTIFMISHDLEEVTRMADRVVVLSSTGEVAGVLPRTGEPRDRLRRMEELIMIDHPAAARES